MPDTIEPVESTEKLGIKETKEALEAINEIAILVAKRFKDGVQFADFTAFYDAFTKDEEFKNSVKAGYDNFSAIPAELKDLDLKEGIDLAATQLGFVPELIDALKK